MRRTSRPPRGCATTPSSPCCWRSRRPAKSSDDRPHLAVPPSYCCCRLPPINTSDGKLHEIDITFVRQFVGPSPNTVHLITFWWYPVLGAKASPRGHLMNVTIVESTSLATVAYDDARKLLQLEFCSRAIYQYFGVPAAVHAALLRAPSKGI